MKYKINFEFDSIDELNNFIKSVSGEFEKADNGNTTTIDLKSIRKYTIRKNKKWTEYEIDHLIENYSRYKTRELAASLGRTPQSISIQISKLLKRGLVKNKTKT